MTRFRFLLLAAATFTAVAAAHADPITTDHIVFSFATAANLVPSPIAGQPPVMLAPAVTQQYSFSFVDGTRVTNLGLQPYTLYFTAEPDAGTTDSPASGSFNVFTSGYADFDLVTTRFGNLVLSGSGSDPIRSVGPNRSNTVTLFLQPGTYTLTDPTLVNSQDLGSVVSASYTITQTTTGAAAPVSVTPEPSSLALLGTGLFGIAGLLRRRV